jgi:hypothetical protein
MKTSKIETKRNKEIKTERKDRRITEHMRE